MGYSNDDNVRDINLQMANRRNMYEYSARPVNEMHDTLKEIKELLEQIMNSIKNQNKADE